jgi:hypothetical protein
LSRVLLLFGICRILAPCSAQSPDEYALKAAIIYKITKFIEWPEDSPLSASPEFTIGIVGTDPFGEAIEKTIGNRPIHDKPVAIKRFGPQDPIAPCHVLFISPSEQPRLNKILEDCQGMPTLTIGEMPQFTQRGGILNLYKEDLRIRFEINLEAAEESGLEISVQILKLARITDR